MCADDRGHVELHQQHSAAPRRLCPLELRFRVALCRSCSGAVLPDIAQGRLAAAAAAGVADGGECADLVYLEPERASGAAAEGRVKIV